MKEDRQIGDVRAPGLLSSFLMAVAFLTRLPVSSGPAARPDKSMEAGSITETTPQMDMHPALPFFPLAGALAGGIAATIFLLAHLVFPVYLAVLIALSVEALLTGALHEDGVADFCDAFGGGRTPEDTLRILADSRTGTYGILGLFAAVSLRAGGLIAIGSPIEIGAVLILSAAAGRLVLLALMAAVPPAPGRDGLAKRIGRSANWRTFTYGALLMSPLAAGGAALDLGATAVSTILIVVFLLFFRRLVLHKIGGVTGDCLGFAAYTAFVLITLSFAATAHIT